MSDVSNDPKAVEWLARMLERDARATSSAGRAAASHHDLKSAELCETAASRYRSAAATLRALSAKAQRNA